MEAIPNTAAWTLDHWPPLRDCLKGGLHAPKICYQVLHVLWIILAEWVRCRNNHFNQGFLPRTEGGLTSIRAINVYSPHIITLWRGFSEQSLPPSCSVPFQIFANLPPPPHQNDSGAKYFRFSVQDRYGTFREEDVVFLALKTLFRNQSRPFLWNLIRLHPKKVNKKEYFKVIKSCYFP